VSADAAVFPRSLPREEAVAAPFDEAVYGEARQLLAKGGVSFKLSMRVPAASLPREKRAVYNLLRSLPDRFYVPPALAKQEGIYDYFAEVCEDCEGPDDQVLAMPRNRRYLKGAWHLPVECRPKDPTDAARTNAMRAAFAGMEPAEDLIGDIRRDVEDCRATVRLLRV
jgi:hypothetical protein